jgi:tetratricopeptide (TPR) repeat protein
VSYINEALKKAQRDRDTRHIPDLGVLKTMRQDRPLIPKKTLGYILVLLIIIGLGFMAYLWFDTKVKRPRTAVTARHQQSKTQDVKNNEPPEIRPSNQTGKRPDLPSPALRKAVPNTRLLYERAANLYRRGRFQDAEKMYKDVLRLNPDHVEALNNLGVVYIQKKDYTGAKSCFEKAIQLRPEFVEPYYNLACLHSIKGEVKEGLIQLKRAISMNPTVRDWAKKDTDLQNLRGIPGFEVLLRRAGEGPKAYQNPTPEVEIQKD